MFLSMQSKNNNNNNNDVGIAFPCRYVPTSKTKSSVSDGHFALTSSIPCHAPILYNHRIMHASHCNNTALSVVVVVVVVAECCSGTLYFTVNFAEYVFYNHRIMHAS